MRDSSLRQWMAEEDYRLTGKASADYLYLNVISFEEVQAIESAAHFAFVGRWGEAEQRRRIGGYDGLELIDNGPVLHESESTRERFRQALDETDSDQ